ncbi:L-lactate permease, partial [Lactobacillus crispatus]
MWISFLLALIPIIWLIYSLAIRKMPAIKACSIGLLITIVLAILGFNLSIVDT